MRMGMKKVLLVVVCLSLIGTTFIFAGCGGSENTDSSIEANVWPMFGRTPDGNRVAPNEAGPKTDKLVLKWKWEKEIRGELYCTPLTI
jgi:hypothetical protein